jgi:hypothetical protein
MSGFLLLLLLFTEAKTAKAQQEKGVRIPYGLLDYVGVFVLMHSA